MTESDGVEEALNSTMRVLLTAAARAGEEVARARQQERVTAADASEARTRELVARLEAEKVAARTSYRGLDDPQWWERADVDEISNAYYTATAWRELDPEAETASRRIEDEAERRYGVDLHDTEPGSSGGPGDVAQRLADAEADRARRESVRASDGVAEAGVLLVAADRADGRAHERVREAPAAQVPKPAAESAAEAAWDTPQRRAATREALAARVDDPRAVEAKSLADLAQAKPATAVTRTRSGTRTRASRTTSPARGLDIDR